MSALYPEGPASVAPALTRASPTYRRQAWIAMLALVAFGIFYVALAGWFCWKAYSLLRASLHGARDSLWVVVGGASAAFIAVFMLKALFFVRRGSLAGLTEVSAREQPELFAFLYRLADEARAPRPHKVFLSPRVNAAVFYDLSPLNLLLPSRKNLEIGLALVNVLNLSELKAVLAHEFGHFAQRSMAVGRWVYVAQQIAGHVVARRDALDRFLSGLSRVDLRIAWLGWLLSLVVWSIRSLVDSFFRMVLAAERALSREMEFQADRISVSLAGSDALIEALYRLQAADTAWDRALAFSDAEANKGRLTADVFAVQTQVIEKLRVILDDPAFGAPARPGADPAAHRIFRKEMAQPSRMWATHPFDHEREDNAKREYHPAPLAAASAWTLFRDADGLRRRASADLYREADPPLAPATPEQTQAALEADYGRESFKRIYRGCYLVRPVTRSGERVQDLYQDGPADRNALYPASLARNLKDLQRLQSEKAQLEAVQAGDAQATDGEIRFRGRLLHRRQLPLAIGKVAGELQAVQERLAAHDRLCRGAGRELARAQGGGWEAYARGLLQLVHYAEHMEANLADAHGALANVVAMVTAKSRVNDKERKRVLQAAGELWTLLDQVHRDAATVTPDAATLERAGLEGWPQALGEWRLGAPVAENVGDWLNVLDSWLRPVQRALAFLRRGALDQLLVTEAALARAAFERTGLGEAPAAPTVPADYPAFPAGRERPRQQKLDWWSRFLTADGWVPGSVRLAAAGGIVASLMGMSGSLGSAHLAVHNGLDREVLVDVGGVRGLRVAPGATQRVELDAENEIGVRARTAEGREIENFRVPADVVRGQYLYNVAAASSLLEWSATYGKAAAPPERALGAQRWLLSGADHVLEDPPERISTKGEGGTRRVLSAARAASPRAVFELDVDAAARRQLILSHARWDRADSRWLIDWMMLGQDLPELHAVLEQRLAENPAEIASLRQQQELASPQQRAQVCDAQRQLAQKNPQNANLQYLVVRCEPEGEARNAAFEAGRQRHPASGWFAFAAASRLAQTGQLQAAADAYGTCMKVAPLAEQCALELARVRRLQQGVAADLKDLAGYDTVRVARMFETGAGMDARDTAQAYPKLGQGRVAEAAQVATANGASGARLLRLAAASDGATEALVQQALRLQPQAGIDMETVWSALGLGIRQGADVQPLVDLVRQRSRPAEADALMAFIEVMRGSRDAAQAEAAAARMSVPVRAQAYVLGILVLGPQAPAAWRDYAKKALFVGERPYLT